MKDYEDHPLSSVLPLMGRMEIDELAADIQVNGLRAPITLLEGKILDGRNRYRACKIVGIEPRFRDFNGEGDPIDFIVSANVKRRHLTASQKALVVAKIARLPRGNQDWKTQKPQQNTNRHNMPICKTIDQVAKEIAVSPRTVRQAKQVLKEAPQETIKAIEGGQKSVATAVKEIKKDKPAELTDHLGRAVPRDMVSEWQRAEQVGKRLRSLASEIKTTISQGFAGPKQDKLKDVIYAEVGNSIISDASGLAYSLAQIIPYALCPTCSGHERKHCALCRKRGWISKYLWNSPAINEAVRKLIQRK